MSNKRNLLLLSLSMITFSNVALSDQSRYVNCFDNIEIAPSFIALESTFNNNLASWYKKVFGMNTVKKFTFPDGNTKGVLMSRGDFVVEVFNSKKIETELKNKQKGVMKFGFYTNANLPELKQCLKDNEISAKRIFKDKNLKAELLLVEDPDGNHFEVISSTRNNFNLK